MRKERKNKEEERKDERKKRQEEEEERTRRKNVSVKCGFYSSIIYTESRLEADLCISMNRRNDY